MLIFVDSIVNNGPSLEYILVVANIHDVYVDDIVGYGWHSQVSIASIHTRHKAVINKNVIRCSIKFQLNLIK